MNFKFGDWAYLGNDKERIVDFYRAEEPEKILAVLIDPALAGLREEGHQFLRDLVEDSIILEQHAAYAGFEPADDYETALRVLERYESISGSGFLYDGNGRIPPAQP